MNNLTTLFNLYWYVLAIAMLLGLFKSPWVKGMIGEWIVNVFFRLFLSKKSYHLIKNVTLPSGNGTTQVDHVIVSQYGVFVIETKNMRGWIFGGASQKQWTQVIYRHRSQFQNPLHQNYKHVKTLQNALNLQDDSIFSLVIFVGDCKFKTSMPRNVGSAFGAVQYIKRHTDVLFTQEEVMSMIEQIEQLRLQRGFATNRRHVEHVKQIVSDKSNSKCCVKCGSNMVKRKAKRGAHAGNTFWGCSQFPQCRHIESDAVS